ncbi:hypothetical protein P9112_009592 [Eukaryota sp. TZLM1-RC]
MISARSTARTPRRDELKQAVDVSNPDCADSLAFHRKLEELLQEERTERLHTDDPSSDFLASLERALSDFPPFSPDNRASPFPSTPTRNPDRSDSSQPNVQLLIPPIRLASNPNFNPNLRNAQRSSARPSASTAVESNPNPNANSMPSANELEKQMLKLTVENAKLTEKRDSLAQEAKNKQSEFIKSRNQLNQMIESLTNQINSLVSKNGVDAELGSVRELHSEINNKIDEMSRVAQQTSEERMKKMVSGFESRVDSIRQQLEVENDSNVVSQMEEFVEFFNQTSKSLADSRRKTLALTCLNNDLLARQSQLNSDLMAIKSDYNMSLSKLDHYKAQNEMLERKLETADVTDYVIDDVEVSDDELSDEGQVSEETDDMILKENYLASNEQELKIVDQVNKLREAIKSVDEEILVVKNEIFEYKRSLAEIELLLKESLEVVKGQIYKESSGNVTKIESARYQVPEDLENFDIDLLNGSTLKILPTLIAKGRLLNIIYEKIFKRSVAAKTFTPRSISALGGNSKGALEILSGTR